MFVVAVIVKCERIEQLATRNLVSDLVLGVNQPVVNIAQIVLDFPSFEYFMIPTSGFNGFTGFWIFEYFEFSGFAFSRDWFFAPFRRLRFIAP